MAAALTYRDRLFAASIVAVLLVCQSALGQNDLRMVFKDAFLVGAAVNRDHYTGRNDDGVALVRTHFNTITSENDLKWEWVHPGLDRYDFEPADRFVAFGEANKMFIVGHTLIWHSQTPAWVFEDADGNAIDREGLLERMRDHITTVVGRYRGRVKGWDVVNEALEEDGSVRKSPWMKIIGPDYVTKAFQFAQEADPDAELYYNDHSLENEPKRKGTIELVTTLRAAGIKVAGVGTQGHYKMDWPTPAQVDETIREFASLGLKVMITELDIDVLPQVSDYTGADISLNVERQAALDPYRDGLPDAVQQALAKRYGELFSVFVRNADRLDRVTFWGVTDRESWLNDWPVTGRTAYPLLFDRAGAVKPAFDAVVRSTTVLP